MSHNDHVHLHGQDIIDGIEEGFALTYTGGGRGKVDYVRAEAFLSQLERDAGTGTALKEKIGNRNIAQAGDLFYWAVDDLLEIVSRFKYQLDILFCQVFYSDKVSG
jgi:hypothetical protein